MVVCATMSETAANSPLTPEQQLATFRLADTNLTVELVAAEPQVRAPVAIAWDADARLFVAEMTDYPSGPVSGRIRLLQDLNADGRYETAIVFATNIAFPNGVMPWRNGLLVTAAPDIWFLADTNGDGRADVREKILTGFAEGNQQLRVNGLFWGLDNWIYGCNGRSDGEVEWADGTTAGSIRRRDFRFRPDTKEFEAIAGNSQFGMGYDDWGHRFPVFNNTPIRHVVLEEKYLAPQPALAGTDVVPNISPAQNGNRVFALTPPNLLIPQPVGFFTSACGPVIYRGTALPEKYRGDYFVCEPVQNVVQRRVLKPSGSSFSAEHAHTGEEFIASTDRWFHGVFTANGPDGALYIVDFYRDLVEHPHWVAPELRDKVDWRKGEEHGRIWRVRAKDRKLAPPPKLTRAGNEELVRFLENQNGWIRDTAHRLLIERRAKDVGEALMKLARTGPTPPARVHALHLLSALSSENGQTFASALKDKEATVRAHAVRLFAEFAAKNDREVMSALTALANDQDARVRLEVACALAAFASEPKQHDALARLARNSALDEWQAIGIAASAGTGAWPLLQQLQPMLGPATAPQLGLLEKLVRSVVATTNASDFDALANWLSREQSPNRFVLWSALLESVPARQRARMAGLIGDSALVVARDTQQDTNLRVAAIRCAPASTQLASLLDNSEPEPVQGAAAQALLRANTREAAQLVFERFKSVAKPVRREMIANSPRRSPSAFALLDGVERGAVPVAEVDPATRQALLKSTDANIKQRAATLLASGVSADREAAVQKYRAALKLSGDRARGAVVFERACSVCHQMQGVGARIGPDLSGIGTHSRETLLVEILDPSRQVLPDFVSYSATTKGGDTYAGFIVNESSTTVTLRRPNEPDITLARTDLTELHTSGRSMMPDGLEAGMTEQDMADLIEFLRRPDRTLFQQSR